MRPEFGRVGGGLALVVMLAVCATVYLPGLGGPLLLDDHTALLPLLQVPPAVLWSPDYLISDTGPLGRPLSMLSFALNAQFSGADFRAWKAVNLVLHLASGVLLYALVLSLFEATGNTATRARFGATVVAAAWLLHPLQVSTVLYTVQRMSELSAFGCLLGMLAYARGRLAMCRGAGGAPWIMFALFVCTPVAALGKEPGLLLVFYCAALEVWVFNTAPRPPWLRRLMIAVVVVPVVAVVAYIAADPNAHLLNAYNRREFGLGERLLTEARVVLGYLRWAVVPRRSDFGFYHDDTPIARTLGEDMTTPLALLSIVALLAAAWHWRRRAPLATFGLLWFFLAQLLESTIFGLELVFEHRNYLALAGIELLLVDCLLRFAPSRLAPPLAVALLSALVFATLPRTLLWGNEGALLHSFVDSHPGSERARLSLASWHAARGEHAQALDVLQPPQQFAFMLARLSMACQRGEDVAGLAGTAFERTENEPRLSNFEFDTFLQLARASLDKTCKLPAASLVATLERLRRVPAHRTSRYRLHTYLAMLYYRDGEPDIALQRLRGAAQIMVHDPFVYYLSAEWLADAGRFDAAAQALDQARRRKGALGFPEVDRFIAATLDRRGDQSSAR